MGDSLAAPDSVAGGVGGSMTDIKKPRRNIGMAAG